MASVAEKVFALVKETVENEGVKLWDVRFVKEGASHYLRIFIDKPEGVNIDDCTNVSHAVDPIIDEADPIDCSYYLEVCSAGLGRELTRDEHFTAMLGKDVKIRLFKAVDGVKEFIGKLSSFENGIVTVEINGENKDFLRKEISKITLEDFD